MTPPRRFRFGLRTLFVVVVIVAIPCAWVGYSLNWIRQRHELLISDRFKASSMTIVLEPTFDLVPVRAPSGLWLFGEEGQGSLTAYGFPAPSDNDLEQARRLFPEANVFSPPWK